MAAVPPVCDFGWKAVDATLPGVDGKTHSIFGEKGPNGLVVVFICNHCPYVKAVIDRIVRDASDLEGTWHRLRGDQLQRRRGLSGRFLRQHEAFAEEARLHLPLSL